MDGEDILAYHETSLRDILEEAHEAGFKHPGALPPPQKMNIVTAINLLEQDYCE